MRVGFVGTGTMGHPMASCLLDAGHELTVNDLRREATTDLCERGAHWADTPRDVAQASEVVFTSLPGPYEMEKVALDPENGLLAGLAPGSAYFDMTTNSPGVVQRVAEAFQAMGIDLMDSPVSQRPPNMTIMAAGRRETFDKYKPVLDAMGRNVFYVGESTKGCVAKLVTQHLGYTNFIAAAEGLLMAVKSGVDLNVLAQIVPVSAGASRAFDHYPRSVYDGVFPSIGSLDIVAKDLSLACQLARDLAVPSPIGDIADNVFKRAQAQGLGVKGFPAAVQILEQMADAEIRAAKETE